MRFSELSKPAQRILTLCREINFGLLTGVSVVDGEPQATAETRKCTFVKLDRPAQAGGEQESYDFTLCASQEQFVRRMRTMGNGRISTLEIRDGHPVCVNIEEAVTII